ncbi:unnamed protein product, partial [Laminaria digitata]
MVRYMTQRLLVNEDSRQAEQKEVLQLRDIVRKQGNIDRVLGSFLPRMDNIKQQLVVEEGKHLKLKREHATLIADKQGLEETNHLLQAHVARLEALRKKENAEARTVAMLQRQLQGLEASQAQLDKHHKTLLADKNRLQENNHGLRAEVARLTEQLAATTVAVDTAAPAELEVATAATAPVGLAASTATPPSVAFVQPVVSPAERPSPSPIAARLSSPIVTKDRATSSSPPAASPSRSMLEITSPSEPSAATSAVGDSALADSDASEAATGAVEVVGAQAASSSVASVQPVVRPTEGPPLSPAATATKAKAAPTFPGITPSCRSMEQATRPSTPLDATFAVGKVVPSPSAVATPSSRKQTPAKARKPAGGEEDPSKCPYFDMHSPLVEKELNAAYGTPRQYARRRPLSSLSINSGGKGATSGGKTPPLAGRTATKP